MYRILKDFLWYSKQDGILIEDKEVLPNWIKNKLVEKVEKEEEKPEAISLDLNGDGKLDDKDKKIANKVVYQVNKKKKKKKK